MNKNIQQSPYKIRFYFEKMSEEEINDLTNKLNIPVTIIPHDDPDWEAKIKLLAETD
jgi:hypothetical protein